MSQTFVTFLLFLIPFLIFAALTVLALRISRPVLKWITVVLAGFLTVVFGLATVLGAIALVKLNTAQPNPVSAIKASASPQDLARMQRYAVLCGDCHSSNHTAVLDGGTESVVPDFLATIYAPNLTPGGDLKNWSDGEIVRAIREGVDRDGKPLIVMPSESFRNMSDADVAALVAYLRSQPPVNHETSPKAIAALGLLLAGAGQVETSVQPPITQPIAGAPQGVTLEYGKYMTDILGCRDCHGADLAGGAPGGNGPPPGPNLTVLVPKWSEADFLKTIRTGTDPTGHQLDPDAMPWQSFNKALTDDELRALYMYLHSLPPTVR
ncbi:MAG: cytochrome c [Anaerolineae bacterium]